MLQRTRLHRGYVSSDLGTRKSCQRGALRLGQQIGEEDGGRGGLRTTANSGDGASAGEIQAATADGRSGERTREWSGWREEAPRLL